ncbi:MAG: PadR family transcriptional regulator [Oscillospiraceae bacterium]|nr:PadR family transcriptional regulator [Oscillospiraceae bacterium]
MTNENAIREYLPMTETMYYILLSLHEPRHGYGIFLDVKALTGGRLSLAAGTIYNSLSRLERDGLIVVCEETERRKVYAIQPSGRAVLQAEVARLVELTTNGKTLIG